MIFTQADLKRKRQCAAERASGQRGQTPTCHRFSPQEQSGGLPNLSFLLCKMKATTTPTSRVLRVHDGTDLQSICRTQEGVTVKSFLGLCPCWPLVRKLGPASSPARCCQRLQLWLLSGHVPCPASSTTLITQDPEQGTKFRPGSKSPFLGHGLCDLDTSAKCIPAWRAAPENIKTSH